MNKKDTPNPGTQEAIDAGCTCPVLDNGWGKGSGYLDKDGKPTFWRDADCPLHGYIDLGNKEDK